ncbi:MAG: MarR family transcriptional regulator [Rhizobiaceae bacterium]|nr:MarR family transcriptional regulator [Rhizobiaceae bacterium]
MTQPNEDQLAALGTVFESFSRRYKLAEATGPERQLNELDKQTLLFVARNPGCGPTDIARFLAVAATTVSSVTDRLAKRGLLDRLRPEKDRRAVALHLTAAGRSKVDAFQAAYRQLYQRMLAPLSEPEREVLIGLMRKILSTED